MLAGNNNLVQAARAVMALGPSSLVVKHGEYGATLFHSQEAKIADLPRAGDASGRSGRPDRCGRQLCGRILRLPCLAA
jgi:hypothetical protein